jgi:type IX secretion system PorP/SprF family membrane protein
MMRKITTLIIFALNVAITFGQDIHFSQFNASPLNLNPALTGLFDGDYRFILNHRNQWSSITIPYKTYSGSFDMQLPTERWHIKNLPKGIWGAGIVINKDNAGDGSLGITEAKISLSYTGKISKDSSQFLTFAIQPGITNKSFNYNALHFDEQWNGDAFDPGLPTGENFQRNSATYLNLGLGMRYHYQIKPRNSVTLGFAYTHFNSTLETFIANSSATLSPKFAIHSNTQFMLTDEIDILPSLLYEHQNTFNETVLGVSGKYIIDPQQNTNLYLGLYMRFGDAIIPTISMDYGAFTVGLSYDVNTSQLKVASNGNGGFEISIIYIMKNFVPLRPGKKICPVYM